MAISKKYNSKEKHTSPRKKHAFDAIIFDIDNVLIDTRYSYLDAIRNTVEIYLTTGAVPFFSASKSAQIPTLLSSKDIDQFKLLGGFNDDWDCCYGLLIYLLSLPVKDRTLSELKKNIALEELSKKATKRPLKVKGITEIFGRKQAVTIEKVARIFQEVYLGKELFEVTSRQKMRYWKKLGLIHKEKLAIKKSVLQKIKTHGISLGISTGRSEKEALYALKKFGVLELFDAITTMDEVKKAERTKKESLRKPHPFSIIKTAEKIGLNKKYLYVGDLPDDVYAANQAKKNIDICSAAFPFLATDLFSAIKELKRANPDFILKSPFDLLSFLGKGKFSKKKLLA